MGKCETGCKVFTGGEIKHHKDCPFYPESLSKKYDEMALSIKQIKSALKMRVSLSKKLPVVDHKVGLLCCCIRNIERIIKKYEMS